MSRHNELHRTAVCPSDHLVPLIDQLRLAVAAYLARFKGSSREHTESDLRCYLAWCADRGLDPLAARRPHLELYIRWMQEIRRFKPSTVSRRFSVTAGFYRTCVIDGLLDHSPAEHVRRPSVSVESPTLGLTHLRLDRLCRRLLPPHAGPRRAGQASCTTGIRTVGITESTRSGPQEPRPPPQLHPGRIHGLRHLTGPVYPAAQAQGQIRHCR
jgi:hypothetical protein